MLSLFNALILGILQGITEFIPVSSSGHLALVEFFLGLDIHSNMLKSFDIILHGGTLLAILIFFLKDFIKICQGIWFTLFKRKHPTKEIISQDKEYLRLFFLLVIATIPGALAGYFLDDFIDKIFRSPLVISSMMLVTALVFYLAEKYPKDKDKKNISMLNSIFIGLAQSLALIPGVSRSGFTIAAGLGSGIDRIKSTRFAFLLAVPIILGANTLVLVKGISGIITLPPLDVILVGFISSVLISLLSIKFLLDFFKKYTLKPFSVYLVVMSVITYGVLVNSNLKFITDFIINFIIPFFRDFAYVIVLFGAFAESIPLLGVLVPGGTAIILSGAIACEADISIYLLSLFAAIGAVVGDFVGFSIGKKYGENILIKYGPCIGFKEEYLYVTHRFCHQYGGFALVLGRFNGIVRPFIPMVIGSSGINLRKFWVFNIVGGTIWAISQVLIGFFARKSWVIIQSYVGVGGGIIFTLMIVAVILIIHFEVKKLKKASKLKFLKKNNT